MTPRRPGRHGRGAAAGNDEPALFFFHFRALNTGWKYRRRVVPVHPDGHVHDERYGTMRVIRDERIAATPAAALHATDLKPFFATTRDGAQESDETFTLTLSNASNAGISEATARGTIENTDHMPAAWLARFGRTVTDQVLGAVEARLAASPARHRDRSAVLPVAPDGDPFRPTRKASRTARLTGPGKYCPSKRLPCQITPAPDWLWCA